MDALGCPGTLLLVGGTSQIAVAVAERLLVRRPLRVVLAARPSPRRDGVAGRLAARGAHVEVVDFEATDVDAHVASLRLAFAGGDVDVAVVAHGVLGSQADLEADPVAAAALCQVNYVAAVSAGLVLATRMRQQGHGVIVALSSVAGQRPRRANYLYGSTKAGLDAFYTGLRESVRPYGARVLVVRPGFVHSRMTRGLRPAPLATTPGAVADLVVAAVPAGNGVVWAPPLLRPLAAVLRVAPRPLLRLLDT